MAAIAASSMIQGAVRNVENNHDLPKVDHGPNLEDVVTGKKFFENIGDRIKSEADEKPLGKRAQAYKQSDAKVVPVDSNTPVVDISKNDARKTDDPNMPAQDVGGGGDGGSEVKLAKEKRPSSEEMDNSSSEEMDQTMDSAPRMSLATAAKFKKLAHKAKEDVKKKKDAKYVIHPDSTRKRTWDVFIGVLVCYSVIVVPYRIGFDVGVENIDEASWELFVDVMFLTDMTLTFFEGYFEDDELVISLSQIRWHYLKTWFAVDIMSAFPLNLMIGLMNGGFAGCQPFPLCGVGNNALETFTLFKTLKLVRLLRLVRLMKLVKLASSPRVKEMIPENLMTIISMLFKITYVAHFIACFWFFVSGVDDNSRIPCVDKYGVTHPDCLDENGISHPDLVIVECQPIDNSSSWVTTTEYNRFDMCGVPQREEEYLIEHYVTSLYWTVTTLMSVGYGDIYAQNHAEMLYAIMTQVTGAFLFGMIIATVTTIIENHNPRASAMTRRIEDIKQYMRDRRVPRKLQKQVKKHYEYYFARKSVFADKEILSDVPEHLHNRIVMFMHRETIPKIKLCQHVWTEHRDVAFIVAMVQNLEPYFEDVGQIVFREGSITQTMSFLTQGKLEFYTNMDIKPHMVDVKSSKRQLPWEKKAPPKVKVNTKPIVHGYLHDGHHFLGYSCIKQTESVVSVRAVSPCHLLSLSRTFLESIETLHEEAYDILYSESTEQERSLKVARFSEQKEVDNDVFRACLCLDYKQVPLEEYKKGNIKVSEMIETHDVNNPSFIRTRRSCVDDSNDEIEGLELKTELLGRMIIDPNTLWKMRWDFFIGFLIVYSFISLPFVTAFPTVANCEEFDTMLFIDWIVDSFFILDIVFNFRTAVYDESAHLYDTRPSAIGRNYIKGWFLIDLPSSLPITQILEAMASSDDCGDENKKGAKVLKLIRMGRLVRLMKIARVLKLGKSIGAGFEIMEVSLAVRNFLGLTFSLFIVAHYFGCGWHIITENVLVGDSIAPDLVNAKELSSAFAPDHMYVKGLYWAFTTMTTVGYGDITPATLGEQVYTMMVMLVGATCFGYIIGSVASLQRDLTPTSVRAGEHLATVMDFLEEQMVSKSISRQMRNHVDYFHATKSPYDEKDLLSRLPEKLRQDIILAVNKDILNNIPILLRKSQPDFQSLIVRHLKPQFCTSKQLVSLHGSRSMQIYFLVTGLARMVEGDVPGLEREFFMEGTETKKKRVGLNLTAMPALIRASSHSSKRPSKRPDPIEKTKEMKTLSSANVRDLVGMGLQNGGDIKPGDFFGHESLLFPGIRQPYSVITVRNSGFYVLDKLSVGEIMNAHPTTYGKKLEEALEKAIISQANRRKGCYPFGGSNNAATNTSPMKVDLSVLDSSSSRRNLLEASDK